MESASARPALMFIRSCVLLSRRWRQRVDERLRPEGQTLARLTVLYWIGELEGPVTQRKLADVVGIEGPTLVRQLHALEAQGLVERLPLPGDRRANALSLTPAAHAILEESMAIVYTMADEVLEGLDRRRLGSATRLVAEARAALD